MSLAIISIRLKKSRYSVLNQNNISIYADETTELYKYYSCLDTFILPSRYEGFALVMYEAFSNGLDVLISDNVPYLEHISNNAHQLPLDIDIWVKRDIVS